MDHLVGVQEVQGLKTLKREREKKLQNISDRRPLIQREACIKYIFGQSFSLGWVKCSNVCMCPPECKGQIVMVTENMGGTADILTWLLTSLQTAAIWPSSMQVSVTTSVNEPPAKYSITTHSSSPTK